MLYINTNRLLLYCCIAVFCYYCTVILLWYCVTTILNPNTNSLLVYFCFYLFCVLVVVLSRMKSFISRNTVQEPNIESCTESHTDQRTLFSTLFNFIGYPLEYLIFELGRIPHRSPYRILHRKPHRIPYRILHRNPYRKVYFTLYIIQVHFGLLSNS
jgi:ABC-type transport system involved in multi-copper enzyme maturation permease subunit